MPASLDLVAPLIVRYGRATHGRKRRESYCFAHYWCLHHYGYPLRLTLDGEVHELASGSVSLVPAGVRMDYDFPRAECVHTYSIFGWSGPRPGRRITPPGELPAGWGTRFRAGAENDDDRFRRVRVWDLLNELTAPDSADPFDLVSKAQSLMAARLQELPAIAQLATELGVSHNLLIRRFRERLGVSPLDYARRLRLAEARRLLIETSLPVKVVASECGYGSSHSLAKALRVATGAGPRELRRNPMQNPAVF